MKIVLFKILGLVIGAKISRIFGVGALEAISLSVLVGHFLDLIASKKVMDIRIKLHQKKMQSAFVKEHIIGTLFQIFGKLCLADGKISQKEKDRAKELAKTVFKLSSREAELAVSSMSKGVNFHLQSQALKFFEFYSNSPEMLLACCKVAFELSVADGKICAEEEKFLRQLGTFWGINESEFDGFLNLYVGQGSKTAKPLRVNDSYQILGCNEKDTDQDIKKKYRILITKYHPDKIQAKELPEDFMTFANQKFQSIQQAYEEIMSLRSTKAR